MRRTQTIFWAFALILFVLPGLRAEEGGLLRLQYAGVIVGIKLDAGASVLLLERGDSGNLLHSDPALWAQTPPEPTPEAPFQAFNGHITWIGPQSMFWARQNLMPERRKSGADWPPDPYVLYGRFSVLERSEQRVLLEGPQSPISGVQLRKELRILEDGGVIVRTEARNIRKQPVALNLWSNTRVDGCWLCLVPVPDRFLRFDGRTWNPYTMRSLSWDIDSGWFHFNALRVEDLTADVQERAGKAFLNAERGVIVAFGPKMVFLKRFATVKSGELAPGQAPVEIYQSVSRDPARNISELEFYNAFRTLQPNETTVIEERWDILPAPSETSTGGRLRWLAQTMTSLAEYPAHP